MDILELANQLRQEQLLISSEKQLLQRLNEKVGSLKEVFTFVIQRHSCLTRVYRNSESCLRENFLPI